MIGDNKISIRQGTKADIPSVYSLIKELAAFENAADKVKITENALQEGGFGPQSIFDFIVAESGDQIIGMALYYPRFSTWNGKTLYLEDLIVTESSRGRGVGKKLMDELIQIAQQSGAVLMHWEVLDWNTPAIEFYKKYQAEFDDEWINVKISFN